MPRISLRISDDQQSKLDFLKQKWKLESTSQTIRTLINSFNSAYGGLGKDIDGRLQPTIIPTNKPD